MKKYLLKPILLSFLLFVIESGFNTLLAADAKSVTTHNINNTLSHIDAAQKAVNDKEPEIAQEHLKFARQAAKSIIGGSYEVKAQRGSRAISSAQLRIREGDTSGAVDSLNQAREIFKSMHGPSGSGGRGGLN